MQRTLSLFESLDAFVMQLPPNVMTPLGLETEITTVYFHSISGDSAGKTINAIYNDNNQNNKDNVCLSIHPFTRKR